MKFSKKLKTTRSSPSPIPFNSAREIMDQFFAQGKIIEDCIENNLPMNINIIDFRAAFDSVCHLGSIKALWFTCQIYQNLPSFLHQHFKSCSSRWKTDRHFFYSRLVQGCIWCWSGCRWSSTTVQYHSELDPWTRHGRKDSITGPSIT